MANMNNRLLAKKIAERKKFLKRIVRFVEGVLRSIGKRTFFYQGSANTHLKSEVKGFYGFDFQGDWGKFVTGGNTITVSYGGADTKHVVLEVEYLVDLSDGFEVNIFYRGTRWQKIITGLAARRHSLITEAMRAEAERSEQQEPQETAKEARRRNLLEEAKLLGLAV